MHAAEETSHGGSIMNAMSPERKLLAAAMFCAIGDSVFYFAEGSPSTNKSTIKSRRYRRREADRNRNEAREWIRAGEFGADDQGFGFGYIWAMLQKVDAVHYDLDAFIAEMETIWRAVDKQPKLGNRIISLIHGIVAETKGYRVTIDRNGTFADVRSAA